MNNAVSVFVNINLRSDSPKMLGNQVSSEVFHTKWAALWKYQEL